MGKIDPVLEIDYKNLGTIKLDDGTGDLGRH